MQDEVYLTVAQRTVLAAMVTGALSLAPACSSDAGFAGDAVVGIRVQSMLVGVSSTGLEWDTTFSVTARLVAALAVASGYVQATGVIEEIVDSLSTAVAAPDPSGVVRIYVDGRVVGERSFGPRSDTFQPSFTDLGWDDVPIGAANVRVEIRVRDEDVFDAEDICTCQLSEDDLLNALLSGRVFHVRVADQCNNQLLFVGVSVIQQ